jgi:hypothetical protein
MSRMHSRGYLVAFTVWVLGWVAVLTLPATTGAWLAVVAVSLFTSNTVIFVIAWMRVQRGDAWREASGTVLPITAEFLMMGFGLRLPTAVANARSV